MTGQLPRPRSRPVLGAALVVACCVVVACSGNPTGGSSLPLPSESTVPGPPASAIPGTGPTVPLTGRPAGRGVDPAAAAVAVIVDGSPGAQAAHGLEGADVIFQEFDNPGSDRFIAIFQSRDVAAIGPVGPTRPVDPQVLGVLHALIANTGGPRGFVEQLHAEPVIDVPAQTHGSSFFASGPAPNLFTTVRRVRAGVGGRPAGPPPIFTFAAPGQAFASTGAAPAGRVTIHPPGQPTQSWVYDARAKTWHRTDAAGFAITVANLIIQQVEYVTPKNPDVTVRSARVYGRGICAGLGAGQWTHCSWSKPGPKTLTNYADARGVPLRLTPGPTWVLLAPAGTTYEVAR